MELIEQDVEVLNKLHPELKQQVFYLLLIRGETLVKENQSIEKAVEFFVKAVALVSQPAEVIMSYEQTLPTEVFKKIVFELQNQNLEKTKKYFAALAPETGLVRFEEIKGPKVTSPTAGSKQWAVVINSDVSEGTVLMSEEPDVAICTLENSQDICDYCFKKISEEDRQSLASIPLSYCSKFCMSKGQESYGKHLENLNGTPAYAYKQLVKVVEETKSYAPLLMLRYIASLLEDELSRQKKAAETDSSYHLFSHYDYLRPAYRVPRESDKAEAVLIRTILEPSHSDISQFLSDEIYVAMKSTVMFNAIGYAGAKDEVIAEEAEFVEESKISVNSNDSEGVKADEIKVIEPVRYSGSTTKSDFFGLYHSYAHIHHSCVSNCTLISDDAIPRRLKLVTKRALKAGDKVTISYMPDPSKKAVERDFYINCECVNCSAC